MVKLVIRSKSRRSTPLGRRDTEALNAFHRIKLRRIERNIRGLVSTLPALARKPNLRRAVILCVIAEYLEALKILVVEVPDRPLRVEGLPMSFDRMKAHLLEIGVEVSERYRFQSFEALNRLKLAFRFPEGAIRLDNGIKTSAEEIILVSLSRLAFPHRWSDLLEQYPGRHVTVFPRIFKWFLNFMVINWGYLLLNNMQWWKPRLRESCEAIRVKLQNLNHVNWRQHHPPAQGQLNDDGVFVVQGFLVALFIDCTMFAFCRVGGVLGEGPGALRVPREVQEAWWNGWKKLHGMKWQTLVLACGMDFHVWGPLSCRRNDLTFLQRSQVQQKLVDLFDELAEIIFHIFGDSAYFPGDVMDTHVSIPGRGMSSVREIIEWTYKDDKGLWKYTDFEHVLRLNKQPVAKIYFVCMLLRNAYVTLHGSQAAEYMDMMPPSLEEWTEQGPRAHPIPDDIIFSPNFVPHELDDDDDYVDDVVLDDI